MIIRRSKKSGASTSTANSIPTSTSWLGRGWPPCPGCPPPRYPSAAPRRVCRSACKSLVLISKIAPRCASPNCWSASSAALLRRQRCRRDGCAKLRQHRGWIFRGLSLPDAAVGADKGLIGGLPFLAGGSFARVGPRSLRHLFDDFASLRRLGLGSRILQLGNAGTRLLGMTSIGMGEQIGGVQGFRAAALGPEPVGMLAQRILLQRLRRRLQQGRI